MKQADMDPVERALKAIRETLDLTYGEFVERLVVDEGERVTIVQPSEEATARSTARLKEAAASGASWGAPTIPNLETDMADVIVHHQGLFLEWSTCSDSPFSDAMTRQEFEAYYRDQYGARGMETLPARLDRALAHGTSALEPTSAEDMVSCNEAGPAGTDISLDEVFRQYRREQPACVKEGSKS